MPGDTCSLLCSSVIKPAEYTVSYSLNCLKVPVDVVRNDYCRRNVAAFKLVLASHVLWGARMVRIRSSQKFFTEDEVANLTGICLEHLRSLARNRHLGTLARAAEAAEAEAEKWLFTNSDLMILTVLHPRCEH